MPRPSNPDNLQTPIMIDKSIKSRIRVYAKPDEKRKGNESDNKVMDRIVKFYEEHHQIADRRPKPTYSSV